MHPDFKWHASFHSGMSAKSDLRAAIDEGVPVGVVANLLDPAKTILALPRYLDAGGKVFIDSGAFGAFQKREAVDWSRVFRAYESVIMMCNSPTGLSIVAPDVVGDQIATIALWEEHAVRVGNWIASGARVIVPLQRGELSAGEMLARAAKIFNTSQFAAGIPSNLEAMSAADAATLHHHDFHVLGRVVINPELASKLAALLTNNPGATLTADANWLRSRIRQISTVDIGAKSAANSPFDSRRTLAVREVLRTDAYPSLSA